MHDVKLLSQLSLRSQNSGVSTGSHWWSTTKKLGEIHSINPTNGEKIASVYQASLADYKHVMTEAEQAFLSWRQVPAPKRGEMIRAIGDELR